MIKRIDEMLKLWAEDLHSPYAGGSELGGGNMIAMLMECKGELIRGTRGSRVLLDESADIELIVNKHLPPQLSVVVREHYCNHDSFLTQKIIYCGCSRKTYYERLHEAHEYIAGMLMGKAA
ncbi:hypothetical protein ABH908_004585 [Pseudomonas frederiksbergensis]|uniref:PA0613 family protein n=1 Tax=Pseudomonas TaxID=286 RepID=UPI000B35DA46|nr:MULTISPECIES: hypothetical protein [Pseudomonas]MBD9609480.1 hypothetical protein [Pseudomonas sp. PDM08]PMY56135.1 hypothetical protein C1X70_02755 [Pseudomonas sp. FW305-53]PMY89002.1 hypothetical protein C1X68_01375 [Pseudomonas sp. FW303-C2]PMY92183.1 hypothetical protein C1X67_15070 [Pseudomonas sp. FW305-62]PNA46256.1 hypothetical protein C1X71_02055 [Pseudomonas sp. FW306-2-2C-A10BC]